MKVENLEKSMELKREISEIERIIKSHKNDVVWIPVKIRKRFLCLLAEHKEELLNEIRKL